MKRAVWFSLLLWVTALYGAKPYKNEIAYLLEAVKTTPCMYERNRTVHTGPEAAKHIIKKYDYFQKEIASAEDFIRLCATESTISGRKYHILCEGEKPYDSDKWMQMKLNEYRTDSARKKRE